MRSSFWKGFLIGGLCLLIFIGLVVPYIGPIPLTVTAGRGFLDWWGNTNLINSFRWYAPDEKIPSTASVSQGQYHYKEMCLRCHGAPGVAPKSWSQNMLPEPPPVWNSTKTWEDGEIFYVVKNGIKMTGMPTWKKSHTDKEIWSMVAFIREMENLDEETKKEFRSYLKEQGHGHGKSDKHKHNH